MSVVRIRTCVRPPLLWPTKPRFRDRTPLCGQEVVFRFELLVRYYALVISHTPSFLRGQTFYSYVKLNPPGPVRPPQNSQNSARVRSFVLRVWRNPDGRTPSVPQLLRWHRRRAKPPELVTSVAENKTHSECSSPLSSSACGHIHLSVHLSEPMIPT